MKKRILSTLALCLSLCLLTAIPVMAGTSKEPTSGSVKVSNSQVTPFTVINVGGGTWDYGNIYYSDYTKEVYSKYYHAKSKHHTTAIIADNITNSGVKDAGVWANSYARGSWTDTGYAYWGLDD